MTKQGRVVAALIIVSASVATWLAFGDGENRKSSLPNTAPTKEPGRGTVASPVPSRSDVTAPRSFVSSERPAVQPPPPAIRDASDRSPLADTLNAPNQTGRQDIAVVLNLCSEYRKRFHGFPVGEDNASFVNALSGQNPARLAFLPRDHSAIDAQGQLLDRWGKPYFFHLLSRDALEIRSSGPDREIYTPDDFVIQSPQARE